MYGAHRSASLPKWLRGDRRLTALLAKYAQNSMSPADHQTSEE
jgi:hypothetical protein